MAARGHRAFSAWLLLLSSTLSVSIQLEGPFDSVVQSNGGPPTYECVGSATISGVAEGRLSDRLIGAGTPAERQCSWKIEAYPDLAHADTRSMIELTFVQMNLKKVQRRGA